MSTLLRIPVVIIVLLAGVLPALATHAAEMDAKFQALATQYLDEFAAFSPVWATGLGDHRYDTKLDEVDHATRQRHTQWLRLLAAKLERIDATNLSRQNQVDFALLRHELAAQIWRITELQEWAWNPLIYTGLAGDSIYDLMARDFGPETERLVAVTKRLEQFPRFLAQVRATLDAARVPTIHAETAVSQNRGILTILDAIVQPRLQQLSEPERSQLANAIRNARKEVANHQKWLESGLLPNAKGDFRIGRELYDRKLAFSLHAPLNRKQIRELAEKHVPDLHERMYAICKPLYQQQYPLTQFPDQPSEAFRRSIIRFGLEKANAQKHAPDQIVTAAKQSVSMTTDFVRRKQLVTLLPDPLNVIIMPEFQRGVSVAYCDSPGPLDVNQKTFYAVSPIPARWTDDQIQSFLREYNTRSLHVLTIHEAMPGHFLQLAHSSRYPGKLRRLLESGVFIEGWAIYGEWMMCEEGFLDHDPLMKLVTLKWYLRDVTNAILDQAIHVDGIAREDAMRLLVEDAFQEEREASGKWVRAQLTSAQLSTYFVGKLQLAALRREAELAWGEDFNLKTYHDRLLSFGSPPPQFVRALLFDRPIPMVGSDR